MCEIWDFRQPGAVSTLPWELKLRLRMQRFKTQRFNFWTSRFPKFLHRKTWWESSKKVSHAANPLAYFQTMVFKSAIWLIPNQRNTTFLLVSLQRFVVVCTTVGRVPRRERQRPALFASSPALQWLRTIDLSIDLFTLLFQPTHWSLNQWVGWKSNEKDNAMAFDHLRPAPRGTFLLWSARMFDFLPGDLHKAELS